MSQQEQATRSSSATSKASENECPASAKHEGIPASPPDFAGGFVRQAKNKTAIVAVFIYIFILYPQSEVIRTVQEYFCGGFRIHYVVYNIGRATNNGNFCPGQFPGGPLRTTE